MTVGDVSQVIDIANTASELQASKTDEFWTSEQLERWVLSDDIMLVAEAEGKVVGFQLTQQHLPTKTGYLSDIAIHEDWRRQGIASRLIEAALSAMKDRSLEYVYGLTKTENAKIHSLLEKHGFARGNAFYWFEKYI